MPSAADTAFQSATAAEGFSARNEGFPSVGDNSAYHSQSGTDLFGASSASAQGDGGSNAVGSARPTQPSPRTVSIEVSSYWYSHVSEGWKLLKVSLMQVLTYLGHYMGCNYT